MVPEHVELLTLPSGEMVEPAQPSWGLDIKCGKGTDISYGPWADRFFLFKGLFSDFKVFKIFQFLSSWAYLRQNSEPKS